MHRNHRKLFNNHRKQPELKATKEKSAYMNDLDSQVDRNIYNFLDAKCYEADYFSNMYRIGF